MTSTAKPKRRKPANGECAAKLDALGIAAFCTRVIEGESYAKIAASVGVSKSALLEWLQATSDRSARAAEARRLSAQTEDDLALEEVNSLPADATAAQIAQMRERVQLRKWRSAKRDPAGYGDRVAIDHGVQEQDVSALLSQLGGLLGVHGGSD